MLADFSYSYDYVGKMKTRENAVTSSIEAFCYDKVNRLIDYALASSCTGTGRVTVAYNDAGNITKKTDVCSTANCYAYPSATSARPHAISSLSGTFNGATNPAFSYDNNGNMYDGAGRSVVYTSFNMSAEMTQGTTKLCWTYDADHARVRMDEVSSCGGSPTSSTYYLNDSVSGLMSEKIVSGSTTTTKDYLQVSGVLIGTRTKVGTGDPSIAYYVVDHLGSIAVTTDEAGVLVCRMTYDPWGKTTASGGSCTGPTRTFTSEESISTGALVNLVNLNARVYDPVLGRFMAADPISNPYAPQDLNLYSYALNSPLAFSDRTGLCESGAFGEENQVETVVVCGGRFPSRGNLGGVGRVLGGGGLGTAGTGGPEVGNIWEYADPFVEQGANGSNNTGPAKTKNGTVPKPRVQSCGFVSITGACAIQTGTTDGSARARAAAAAYHHGKGTHPVTAELEALLANAPREMLISVLESLQSAYDAWESDPSLENAAYFEFEILSAMTAIMPSRQVASKGFQSFAAFKYASGSAGANKAWHHIVEQTAGNIGQFGAQAIHNTHNLIPLDVTIHRQISGFYSSIQPFTGGVTVRSWLSGQSFEAQTKFGLEMLRRYGVQP